MPWEAGWANAVDDASKPGLQVRLHQTGPIPLAVELECGAGELLALVGPSGAGKTTILRAISGLYRPQHGYIACGGQDWLDTERSLDLPPHQRRAGLVFQAYALFPHLTALANIQLALGHLPRPERPSRASALVELVNLRGFEDRKPAELSGGQQQRVAVARALARDPYVLLLDEPFSAVDRRTRRVLYEELKHLREKVGVPIVMVTHDLDEAARLANRIAVIDHGTLLQILAPAELATSPLSPRVRFVLDLPEIEPDASSQAARARTQEGQGAP